MHSDTAPSDRAINDLRQAAEKGLRIAAWYRYEPALAALRKREDFKLLMMDLAMPIDPFVKSHK